MRIVRSKHQFADAASAQAEVARWAEALKDLDAPDLGFLLDWRESPLATDPEILREVVTGTNAIGQRFARHAVLLTSAVGDLQARRLQRAHESEPSIFTDEDKALDYVLGRTAAT